MNKLIKINYNILILTLCAWNLSCQRQPVEKSIPPVESIKQENIKIKTFPLSQDIKLFQWPNTNAEVLLHQTSDIFLFAEGLMELGRLSDRQILSDLGHKTISSFYAHPDNYTSYNMDRTNWVKIAFGIKDISECSKDMREYSECLQHNGRETILLEGPPQYLETKSPNEYTTYQDDGHNHKLPIEGGVAYQFQTELIKPMITYIECHFNKQQLYSFYNNLNFNINCQDLMLCQQADQTSCEEVDRHYSDLLLLLEEPPQVSLPFTSLLTANNEIVRSNILSFSMDYLTKDSQQSQKDALVQIQNRIEDFKSFLISTQSSMLTDNYLTSDNVVIENINAIISEIEILQQNINIATQEADSLSFLENLNTSLQNLFSDLPISPPILNEMNQAVELFRNLPKDQPILNLLLSQPVRKLIILREFANRLNENLLGIAKIVKDTIISGLQQQIAPENIYDVIHLEARSIVADRILNEEYQEESMLPGIEFSNIQMTKKGDQIAFVPTNSKLSFTTNGLTLGTAMSVLAERLKGLSHYEKKFYDNYNHYPLLFSLFNKSLSMVGHYILDKPEGEDRYREVLPTSFFRPINRASTQDRDTNVKIYNYYGQEDEEGIQPGYFAIPDQLALKHDKPFTVDLEKMQEPMLATAIAQAEMIRGASKMLVYLRPDRQNDYNEGMGQITVTEQVKEVVFPKLSVFNLHLGIAGVNLINLQRQGLNIYDLSGQATDVRQWDWEAIAEDGSENPKALMASIHDVREGVHSILNHIDTINMARLMMANEEFIHAVKDLDTENIDNISQIDRNNYKKVSDGIIQLRKLNLGLKFFITTKLQKEEGCFVDNYDVQTKRSGHTMSFDTQVQTLMALVQFYKEAMEITEENGPQGYLLKTSILNAFNCLQEKFFDRENLYYVARQGEDERANLREITDFLRLLYKLEVIVENEADIKQSLDDLRSSLILIYIRQITPLYQTLYQMFVMNP